ncbi:MAG: glycosyltransferase family 2 protein [Chloroflexi bacterium]|nr:glycosyltransferase family 2 protein [Chloroflexota bacterium]
MGSGGRGVGHGLSQCGGAEALYVIGDLGIAIVSWNVRDLLAACLASVYVEIERSGLSAGVWVVDNASSDGSEAMVRDRFPQAHLIENDHNSGFAAANNQAMRGMGFREIPNSKSQIPNWPFAVLLLNPDTIVKPGALGTMVDFMRTHPRAGIVGAKLLNPDGSSQECAFDFPGVWQAFFDLFPPSGQLARLTQTRLNGRYPPALFERGQPFHIGHPLGAAFMARGEAIQQVGLMDEGYHMYCEEIDWAWRMRRAGWEAYCVPRAQVIHYGGQSTSQVKGESFVNLWRSRKRLYETHGGRVSAALVGAMVQIAMKRRTRSGPVSSAYSEVARIWR